MPDIVLTGPITQSCPACFARPGEPCHTPTGSGRRDVKWFHLSREAANRCICADMLPEGAEPRPCPQHGWTGEGTDRPNRSEETR